MMRLCVGPGAWSVPDRGAEQFVIEPNLAAPGDSERRFDLKVQPQRSNDVSLVRSQAREHRVGYKRARQGLSSTRDLLARLRDVPLGLRLQPNPA